MKHIVPGKKITRADGRRMLVERVVQIEGLRIVWWRQISELEVAA